MIIVLVLVWSVLVSCFEAFCIVKIAKHAHRLIAYRQMSDDFSGTEPRWAQHTTASEMNGYAKAHGPTIRVSVEGCKRKMQTRARPYLLTPQEYHPRVLCHSP